MNIDFHKKFLKSYPKLDIKIRKKFDEKLEILEQGQQETLIKEN